MFNSIIADRYYLINELGEPKQYQFRIESIGAIPPIKILYQSLIIIKEKILNFIANVINQDSDKVNIIESKSNIIRKRLAGGDKEIVCDCQRSMYATTYVPTNFLEI